MAINTDLFPPPPSSPMISWNRFSCIPKRIMASLEEEDDLDLKTLKKSKMELKRPAKIVIPETEYCEVWNDELIHREVKVEGSGYCVVSRRGSRHAMEDAYDVITNINGNQKQAFFGVYDGHGGREAVDFVAENLGKNVIEAVKDLKNNIDKVEQAIKAGYLKTDREFLDKGLNGGACAATVVLKDGELYAANVGDCRVVMSRNGAAGALTSDQNAGREDERVRIEESGGYANFHNGVWRVQSSLAVSRAIGDASMKAWIIPEPETKKLHLTKNCEFLILASDGLWLKVTNQEAVDIVRKHTKNRIESCKELAELASSRGSRDDITLMIVDIQKYVQ